MELQLCNYDKKSNTTCDMQCNFIIIILTIIYNILIGIIIFIYQPIEVPIEVETEETNEEELLLANNTKERPLALQAAYKEQLQILFEKRMNIFEQLETLKCLVNRLGGGYIHANNISLVHIFHPFSSGGQSTNLRQSLTVNDLLLLMIYQKIYPSMEKDMATIDEEILIIAKKAGLFQVDSDLWNYLHKYIEPSNQFYNDCKNVLLKM